MKLLVILYYSESLLVSANLKVVHIVPKYVYNGRVLVQYGQLLSLHLLIVTQNSTEPQATSSIESESKHNSFKHTEEVTKMLEDFKKKEQEKKSKDAFLKSLTTSQVIERKDNHVEISNTIIDFGKCVAESLSKEKNKNTVISSSAGKELILNQKL